MAFFFNFFIILTFNLYIIKIKYYNNNSIMV